MGFDLLLSGYGDQPQRQAGLLLRHPAEPRRKRGPDLEFTNLRVPLGTPSLRLFWAGSGLGGKRYPAAALDSPPGER